MSTIDSVCASVCLSVTLLQIDSSFCFSMESSHFLAVSSPCGTLQNVVLRFWICFHGNEIWAFFHKFHIASSVLFPISGPPVLHDPLYKTLFLDFLFGPPNAKNLFPKYCTKSPITQLVWHIDRRCLGLLGGFRGWPIQWNHAKCCEPPLLPWQRNLGYARRSRRLLACSLFPYLVTLVLISREVTVRFSWNLARIFSICAECHY